MQSAICSLLMLAARVWGCSTPAPPRSRRSTRGRGTCAVSVVGYQGWGESTTRPPLRGIATVPTHPPTGRTPAIRHRRRYPHDPTPEPVQGRSPTDRLIPVPAVDGAVGSRAQCPGQPCPSGRRSAQCPGRRRLRPAVPPTAALQRPEELAERPERARLPQGG